MNCFRGLFVSLLFLLIAEKLELVNGNGGGYHWTSIKSGQTLPKNIVPLYRNSYTYIGRARHFDEILPAEVYKNGTAAVYSCNKFHFKEHFEVLTKSNDCEWVLVSDLHQIDETVVRVGTAWNGEPTYLGVLDVSYYDIRKHMANIYLTSLTFKELNTPVNSYNQKKKYYLSCTPAFKWIDTLALNIPNNTVTGGKSEDGYDIYVAKLKKGCDIVGGQAIPEIGTAMAFLNNGTDIDSIYCQVLVGELNEYTWMPASDGEIPDYAVVAGKNGIEMEYVARLNKTLGYITHSKALRDQLDYEILVANPLVSETEITEISNPLEFN